MKRKFIIDEEINLLAKDAKNNSNDYLNTALYADVLKKSILNAPVNKGFTIGLFGEWGSGKSSIIKTVEKIITEEEKIKGKKVKMITYDAWKYANDSFRRMFLLQMQKDLNFKESDFMSLFYNNKTEESEIKIKLNKTKLFFILIVLSLLIISIYAVKLIPSDLKVVLYILSLLGGFLTQIFQKTKVFDELKVSVQSPLLFAPEQFEACFDEMVKKAMTKYNFIEKKMPYFKDINHEKGIDKLIIVIDNIDRCHKELAYELLTNVKNFLGDSHEIVFIIPVDDKALKRHISSTFRL
jgi:predicted KAP-like P-loop ATPase